MSAREELNELFASIAFPETPEERDAAERAIRDMIKPRTITTVEELDALPDCSVVMNCFGDASTVHWELRERKATAYHHLVKHGPATVLYTPKES